jgi:hypothetical protein
MPLSRTAAVQPGQIRRHSLLGTDATYQVLGVEEGLARVSVLEAPGLESGTELRLSLEAVGSMEILAEAPAPAREAFRAWTKPRPTL